MFSRLTQQLIDTPGWVADIDGPVRRAAVAAVFAEQEGEPALLFIRRADNEADPWSGHIAFPGGRVDATDAGVEAAVCREVLEEVGLELAAHGAVLGRLSEVVSPPMVVRVVVTPFVYLLHSVPDLVPEPAEVASIHWFGLDRLLSGEGRGTFRYRHGAHDLDLDCIDLDGERIWGMTLRIVDELLERIRRVG